MGLEQVVCLLPLHAARKPRGPEATGTRTAPPKRASRPNEAEPLQDGPRWLEETWGDLQASLQARWEGDPGPQPAPRRGALLSEAWPCKGSSAHKSISSRF